MTHVGDAVIITHRPGAAKDKKGKEVYCQWLSNTRPSLTSMQGGCGHLESIDELLCLSGVSALAVPHRFLRVEQLSVGSDLEIACGAWVPRGGHRHVLTKLICTNRQFRPQPAPITATGDPATDRLESW